MFEYLIVFAVVAVAGYFTIKKLIGETKGGSCADCSCSCGLDKNKLMETIEKLEKEHKL
jgi:hypothetical protein